MVQSNSQASSLDHLPSELASLRTDGGPALRSADEVVHAIESRIMSGDLLPGQRLPSVRAGAKELGLAPNTVAAAYRKLTDRGMAHGEGRRGTFVTDRGSSEQFSRPFAIGSSSAGQVTDVANGNPDPDLLPDLHQALGQIPTDRIEYGADPIDQALAAAFHADIAADLEPELPLVAGDTLAVVGGALDGIERVMTAHLRPGDRVAVEDPGYPSVLNLVKALSLRPIPLPVDTEGPTPDGLRTALNGGAQAIIVTPRAQNPTGAAITGTRAAALAAALVPRPDVLLIEDDHAGPIAGAPYRSIIDPDRERWAVIRSVAKSLGPDLRVAALVGDRTTVGRVINRQILGTGWVSHILQRLTHVLLNDRNRPADLARAATSYTARRQVVIDTLAAHGVAAWGASGLNVWVPVTDEAHAVAGMQEAGYAVLAGTRFRQQSGPAVRVSIGTADPDTLAAAAAILGRLVTGGSRRRSA